MAVSMKWFVFLVTVLCVFCSSSAHLCLLSPPQRGSMSGINKPGAADCFLVKGPCGDRPSKKDDGITLSKGQNFTVTFQKNLDHFNKSSPGYFSISFGDNTKLKEIGLITDRGEPSLTLYMVNVVMPTSKSQRLAFETENQSFLQVKYVTKNPKAPPVFYQCADVTLT